MNNPIHVEGRVALVTGAGQGVGRATCLALAAAGARAIVVNDFHAARAEAVCAEIRAAGGEALAAPADVTDLEALALLVADVRQRYGGLDVLVNNAGNAGPGAIGELPPFWQTGPADWARWIGTNFYGVLNACRVAIPLLIESDFGRIITVISDAGRVGEPHLAVYSGAKAGAAGFMRAIAKGLGRYNVTANCVALGTIRTPGIADMLGDAEKVKQIERLYTIRRLGEPEDAAAAIIYLASSAAGWVTGQTLPVNGGYSFNQ
ncbi:MAG: SDR family oxidoreductase [Gammaproteobacteria bacterium]|nr:SDR family oxidoreductase [Gammaproteobacteria bacterium]MBI5617587.1 SDR family oxidoreductase [Gammaproteobacteria bacterium]